VQEVRSIKAELQPQGQGSGEPHLISAAWLEEWANADATPPPVDNGTLLCSHGKLDPGKVAQMKLISGTAWGQLQVSCCVVCCRLCA
jgi:ubiquitin carboxyl-terminal hydrolase 48